MKTIFALTIAAIAALGCDTTEDVGSSRDAAPGPAQELLCSASNPCPDGQFCFNGLCAIGCNNNDECAADQYCDTEFDRLCHNRTVTVCPDTPCADTQICVQGFCSTPAPDTQCTPSADGNDGCDRYSLCIEDEEDRNTCHTFPGCPDHGECPTGLVGAVCNDGIVPNKAHICLTGLCKTVDNCPADWHCVKGTAADVVGFCSNGSMGSPCAAPGDCIGGLTCQAPMPGYIGFCL